MTAMSSPRGRADIVREIAAREAAIAAIGRQQAVLDDELAVAREQQGDILASARLAAGDAGGENSAAARRASKLIDELERKRADLAAEAAAHDRELEQLRDAVAAIDLQELAAKIDDCERRWIAHGGEIDRRFAALVEAVEQDNELRGEMRALWQGAGRSIAPFNVETSPLSLFGLSSALTHQIRNAGQLACLAFPGRAADILEIARDRRTYAQFLRDAIRQLRTIQL